MQAFLRGGVVPTASGTLQRWASPSSGYPHRSVLVFLYLSLISKGLSLPIYANPISIVGHEITAGSMVPMNARLRDQGRLSYSAFNERQFKWRANLFQKR